MDIHPLPPKMAEQYAKRALNGEGMPKGDDYYEFPSPGQPSRIITIHAVSGCRPIGWIEKRKN